MFDPKNYLYLLDEIETLFLSGYSSYDIAILYSFPLASVVDDILKYSKIIKTERKEKHKQAVETLKSKITQLSTEELMFMYNDVVVRKLNQIDCMKTFRVPYSLSSSVTNRLKELSLDSKLNFLKKSKYYNDDQQTSTFLKIHKLEKSLANHYQFVYRQKCGIDETRLSTILNLLKQFTLSCEEIAYKFNLNVVDLRSLISLYEGRFNYPSIEEDKCFQLVIATFTKNEITCILTQLRDGLISETSAALSLNIKIQLWKKIKSKLLNHICIDETTFKLTKKKNQTISTLRNTYGNEITNVAQIDSVKNKIKTTINTIQNQMTRKLSINDNHPTFYEFSKMSKNEIDSEIDDLIMNRGYRIEDIVSISDIEKPEEIYQMRKRNNKLIQLNTADYQLRIDSQLLKFKNLDHLTLNELNEKFKNLNISSKSDLCKYLYLPFKVFNRLIEFSDNEYIEYNENLKKLLIPQSYLNVNYSSYESCIIEFFNTHQIKFKSHDKSILDGLELDFYLPDKKIGIEINPQFTHNSNLFKSQQLNDKYPSKPENYHFTKYKKAKDKQITLIQLYEWDFDKSKLKTVTRNRLKSILCPSTSLYARKCEFKEVSVSQAKSFLNQYHTSGYANALYKYGLFYSDELVAVATFSKSKSKRFDFELKRLAFKADIKVIGGTSKLVKNFFISHPEVNSIYSYSDNDWGNGRSYLKSGFTFDSETGPSLKYVSVSNSNDTYSWQIQTSIKSPKSVIGFDRLSKNLSLTDQYDLNEYIEKELTNRDGKHKGYDRIFTSGSKKWIIKRNDLKI